MKWLAGLRRRPAAIVAVVVLVVTVLASVAPRAVVPNLETKQNLKMRLKQPGFMREDGFVYALGSDALGRDIASLVVVGARPALTIGLGSVALALLIGVPAGLVSGYTDGVVSQLIMRLVEIQLAFPFFLIAVVVAGMLGPSVGLIIVLIGLGTWVPYARVIRSEVLDARTRDFVQAAQALGAGLARILFKHVLSGSIPSIIVLASFNLAAAILLEASLSFVGLGAPSASPSWGRMLSAGRDYVATAWWLTAVPGAAIFLVVSAVNIISEYTRDIVYRK